MGREVPAKLDFDAVTRRLREALNVPNDRSLAIALGMKPNAFYNRRPASSVPVGHVINICRTCALSLDWILFGRRHVPPISRTGRDVEIVQQRLAGFKVAQLADRHGITERQIWRVLARERSNDA